MYEINKCGSIFVIILSKTQKNKVVYCLYIQGGNCITFCYEKKIAVWVFVSTQQELNSFIVYVMLKAMKYAFHCNIMRCVI